MARWTILPAHKLASPGGVGIEIDTTDIARALDEIEIGMVDELAVVVLDAHDNLAGNHYSTKMAEETGVSQSHLVWAVAPAEPAVLPAPVAARRKANFFCFLLS